MSLIKQDIEVVIKALMENGLDRKEAVEELKTMRREVMEGEDPEELLYDIGLEPDYVFALLI